LAGRVLKREEFPTDGNSKKTLDRLVDHVQKFLAKQKGIEGVGVSLPGLVDPETGNAQFIPHFKWRDWPVADRLRAATGLPVNNWDLSLSKRFVFGEHYKFEAKIVWLKF